MSKYTAEQVEVLSERDWLAKDVRKALRDYAALLREREAAKAGVTAEIVKIARKAQESMISVHSNPEKVADDHMRAALEAVAPMFASARVPDELKSAPASPLHPLWGDGYLRGWNACRDAMLAAAGEPNHDA